MSVDLETNSDQLPLFGLEVAFSQSEPVVGPSAPARHVYLVYCNVQDAESSGSPLGLRARTAASQQDVEAQLLKRVSLF